MNEKTTTPIGRIADLLVEMAKMATEAERQKDAATEDAASWYRHYMNVKAQLEATETRLVEKIKENEELRGKIDKIEGYIENMQKGAQDNE